MNPNILGEQYQHGEAEGFMNIKKYILARDKYTCQICKKKNTPLHVHHIKFKSKGGTDQPGNLITLCDKCHMDLHAGKVELNVIAPKVFIAATHLNILKDRIYEMLCKKFGNDNVFKTFGYITSYLRLQHNLPKEHYIDARIIIIANACNLKNDKVYQSIKLRRHNRKLHDEMFKKNGKKRSVRLSYKVFNYQSYDIVEYNDKDYHNLICYISSRRKNGNFMLKTFNGIKIECSYKHITKLIQHSNSILLL